MKGEKKMFLKNELKKRNFNAEKELEVIFEFFVNAIKSNPGNINLSTLIVHKFVNEKYKIHLKLSLPKRIIDPDKKVCDPFRKWYYICLPVNIQEKYGIKRIKDMNIVCAISCEGGTPSHKNTIRGIHTKDLNLNEYLKMRLNEVGIQQLKQEVELFFAFN